MKRPVGKKQPECKCDDDEDDDEDEKRLERKEDKFNSFRGFLGEMKLRSLFLRVDHM